MLGAEVGYPRIGVDLAASNAALALSVLARSSGDFPSFVIAFIVSKLK